MKKITIRDVEKACEPVCSLDELKESGFEMGSSCKEIDSVVNKLEIELAKKRLTHKERQIIGLIEIGMSYRQIEEELGISSKTISNALSNIKDKIN
jgi:DNA-binding NarL/FixJ family response regulator